MPYLFVYGTFRMGCSEEKLIAGADLLGSAETVEQYALCLVNNKPVVTKRPMSTIKGEVYSLTEEMLTMVDRLRKHPHINKRELVPVKLNDGNTVEAWLYFHMHPLRESVFIESGDYTETKP